MRTHGGLVILLLLLASGCVSAPKPRDCPAPDGFILTGPSTTGEFITRSPNADIPILYWAQNLANESAYVGAGVVPNDGGFVRLSSIAKFSNATPPPNGAAFGSLSLVNARRDVPANARLSTDFNVALRLLAGGCDVTGVQDHRLRLTPYAEGERVKTGAGAYVHTAGFWTNGTLFYTNIDRVHNDTLIPRAGWYDFEGGEPLPVYVYNSSAKERPHRYNDSRIPGRDVFVPTIEGFNEALKGMETTQSKVVLIPPEKAYTNPKKILYGDALVFYIEIEHPITIPCPLPTGPICDPRDSLPPPLGPLRNPLA